jgi:hypothetical protein
MVHPPTQDDEQVHQEEACDQGGAQEEQVMDEEAPPAPPTQVRATIQRNHPVDQILGDISKGVTTRSRLAIFCEHYSFVSSIKPFRVEEALQDLDWVLAMQEELNNFKRNEVWSLVLGRRRRRHPSLDAFADLAGSTETRRRTDLPFARHGAGRRPMTRSSHLATTSCMEAHV